MYHHPACLALLALWPVFGSLLSCQPDYKLNAKPPDVNPADVTACGFTQVMDGSGSATDFWSYDCNPVFTTTNESWAPQIDNTTFLVTEVLGHPFYQLWYTGVANSANPDGWSLGYAVSAEGTDWVPSTANPLIGSVSGAWDSSSMDAMQVVWDPDSMQYVMIYQGLHASAGNLGMGVLTSPDGVAWTSLPQNPVYDLEQASGGLDGWCWPLGLYLGPVAGYTGYAAGYDSRTNTCSAYELDAANLTNWTPSNNSYFPAGSANAWDSKGQLSLAVASLDGQDYLFYVGFGAWVANGQYQESSKAFLGMATKDSSGNWKRQTATIPVNNTAAGEVTAVAARTVGSRVNLWVTDNWSGQNAVGYFIYDPLHTMTASGDSGP